MSTTIHATCPSCGDDVVLPSDDVVATSAPALGWGRYAFTCPLCDERVQKDADDAVIRLLAEAGVRLDLVVVPAEVLEPHWGAPLTYDDVLDFALVLERAEDLVSFAAAGLPLR